MVLLIYRRLIQSCVAVGAHRGRPGRTHPCPRRVLAAGGALENRTVMSTLFVSPTGSYNGQPAFTTIQSAVNAAVAGDGIVVAKATYHENVTIPVAVNLQGAESGVDPNSGTRSNPAHESIVSGSLTVRASNVTINGFTVQNSSGYGISVANGVGKTQILDNILQDNHVGLMLQGDNGTSVTENLIENSVGPNVDVAGGTGDSFSRNSIQGAGTGAPRRQTDSTSTTVPAASRSSTTRSPSTPATASFSSRRVPSRSRTTHSRATQSTSAWPRPTPTRSSPTLVQNAASDGIEVSNSVGNKIENNTIAGNGSGGKGQGILLNTVTSTTVSGNTVSNDTTNGIDVENSSGVNIEHNTVTGNGGDGVVLSATASSSEANNALSGNANGIHLNGSSNNNISSNQIQRSTHDGIWLDPDSTGNKVTGNLVSGSGVFDAEDDSTGTKTAGTANTWTGNTIGARQQRGWPEPLAECRHGVECAATFGRVGAGDDAPARSVRVLGDRLETADGADDPDVVGGDGSHARLPRHHGAAAYRALHKEGKSSGPIIGHGAWSFRAT